MALLQVLNVTCMGDFIHTLRIWALQDCWQRPFLASNTRLTLGNTLGSLSLMHYDTFPFALFFSSWEFQNFTLSTFSHCFWDSCPSPSCIPEATN